MREGIIARLAEIPSVFGWCSGGGDKSQLNFCGFAIKNNMQHSSKARFYTVPIENLSASMNTDRMAKIC